MEVLCCWVWGEGFLVWFGLVFLRQSWMLQTAHSQAETQHILDPAPPPTSCPHSILLQCPKPLPAWEVRKLETVQTLTQPSSPLCPNGRIPQFACLPHPEAPSVNLLFVCFLPRKNLPGDGHQCGCSDPWVSPVLTGLSHTGFQYLCPRASRKSVLRIAPWALYTLCGVLFLPYLPLKHSGPLWARPSPMVHLPHHPSMFMGPINTVGRGLPNPASSLKLCVDFWICFSTPWKGVATRLL